MTRLILIRHGETVWNRERRMQGQQDSPLSELGMWQARQLARRLAQEPFAALYSSDLGRAHETAKCVADVAGRAILMDAGLRERHFGVFEGLTSFEIECSYPKEHLRFRSRDPEYVVPGGESAREFRDRCLRCLDLIARRHAGDTVAVVTHGLVLDMVYRAAQGIALTEPRTYPLLNASLNVFARIGDGWRAESWGDVAHLADAAITEFDIGGT